MKQEHGAAPQCDKQENIKIMAVVGPTASGKSDFAVALAGKYHGEVVSCDSMQIYKHMSIATAKPTVEQMQGIEHHLVDFLEPSESFSVASYVEMASEAVEQIVAKGKMPILCGGTGLYFHSFIDGISFSEAGSDAAYRKHLEQRAQTEGAQALLEELRTFDPVSAQKLHPNNLKRIIRAMEHYKLTGMSISEQNERSKAVPSRFEPLIFGIGFENRQLLYDRINTRVDNMLKAGLLEEAAWYFSQDNFGTAGAAIGYKELKAYFDGACTLEEAVENLKKETRHYAKRQMTWFKRDPRVHWLYADQQSEKSLLEQAEQIIEQENFCGV